MKLTDKQNKRIVEIKLQLKTTKEKLKKQYEKNRIFDKNLSELNKKIEIEVSKVDNKFELERNECDKNLINSTQNIYELDDKIDKLQNELYTIKNPPTKKKFCVNCNYPQINTNDD